jgi:hypothetical protein
MVVTVSYRCAVSLDPSQLRAVNREQGATEEQGASVRARTKKLLGWSLWLVTLGCCAGGLLAALLWIRPLTLGLLAEGAGAALAFPLGYATIGLVLALRRPGNPIGWLYGASGLVWALVIPFEPWLDTLVRDQRPLALAGQVAVVFRETSWALAVAFGITLPFLLLPDGRLRSRRWRLVVADTVAGVTMLVVGGSLGSGQLTNGPIPIDKPFGLPGAAGRVAVVVAYTGLVLYAASLPAALLCVVLRFRASRGVERQQLRWVTTGAAIAVLVLLPFPGKGELHATVAVVGVLCVPVSVAVAVLRYRLWDLDRLVSRTVTYAVVTALLALPYLLILPAATRLAGSSGSLAVAGATLAAAALFQPLRRRVQDLVDRRFNRRRYDAARTVDAFARRLREQVDLDALSADLLAVVDQTVAPTRASLWLRPSSNSRLPA